MSDTEDAKRCGHHDTVLMIAEYEGRKGLWCPHCFPEAFGVDEPELYRGKILGYITLDGDGKILQPQVHDLEDAQYAADTRGGSVAAVVHIS